MGSHRKVRMEQELLRSLLIAHINAAIAYWDAGPTGDRCRCGKTITIGPPRVDHVEEVMHRLTGKLRAAGIPTYAKAGADHPNAKTRYKPREGRRSLF